MIKINQSCLWKSLGDQCSSRMSHGVFLQAGWKFKGGTERVLWFVTLVFSGSGLILSFPGKESSKWKEISETMATGFKFQRQLPSKALHKVFTIPLEGETAAVKSTQTRLDITNTLRIITHHSFQKEKLRLKIWNASEAIWVTMPLSSKLLSGEARGWPRCGKCHPKT